ncbi:MmgE/PrpD family protein [Saccharopolyspora phatthalungensis]|uniref:2-methylcitrate dehydratase PrpD n=1 Tax=Saccharopolyspora phatthalungensis TaxID=664693 RepID=A0A840QEH5_9PSEU|nr:MmgE/PrpD family protein [Saccharopolyspora phatthalungensis]MBB5158391.1 2-methylcitrate dehydratase PrpD [Saccharopolyspora phatthalungensis]
MASIADSLAQWAAELDPGEDDLALAQLSLVDTAAVALAAREHPLSEIAAGLPDAARWAAVGHVLDFDDLHLESTTHISVVTVPAVLATGGDARAYLAGAGVMARLGTALGWPHYRAGWHATCTAGAPAAAVAAGTALGLSTEQLATAMALAVPAAGGVQNAFGTYAKSLQVGFAAQAGVRAARLAQAGATADPSALDAWLELVGGAGQLDLAGPAVPGGRAIKVYPCCYAMQRPIAALRDIRHDIRREVRSVRVSTPKPTVKPLIHDRPGTGLEGKFSLPYAVATALLDDYPDFAAFTDDAVNREPAQRLLRQVEVTYTPGEEGLLTGEVEIEVEHGGPALRVRLAQPPGAPSRPPTDAELREKFAACGADVPTLLAEADWESVRALLGRTFPRTGTVE